LIVAPNLFKIGKQLLESSADIADNKSAGVVNPYANIASLIVEPELADDEWYLVADRKTVKVGYLAGTGRRPVINIEENLSGGVTYACLFDFGVAPEDYRGMVKGK
jgi:hypothetical protein